MTTAIPSGLGATWGVCQESTVGTFYSTGMRWIPVMSDKVKGGKKSVQSGTLHGGLYELGAHRRLTFHEAKGAVELDVTDKQLGLLLKNMIGSTATATQQGATAAYLQVHTPGDLTGLSLSLQSGRPFIGGTLQAMSYNGAKISDWEISVATSGLAKLMLTFDAMDESISTGYVAPSYIKSNVLAFVDAQLLIGGTVTTTANVASITGAAAPVGTVKSVSIKGTNGMAIDRQQIGSLTKREQLANAFRKYSGQIEVEWANTSDWYAAYYADTPIALQLNFTGQQIAAGYNAELNVLIPQIFLNDGPPETAGPDILRTQIPFDIQDDGTDPPIQFTYQSTDTAV